MPYHALQLNRLPKFSAGEVLTRYDIQVMEVNNISEISENIHQVFLEAKRASQLYGTKTLSAYSDLRPSRLYPKTRIGLMCSICPCHSTEAKMFSVRCRAFADGCQLGGEAFVTNYEEAKDLALSFVNYAGNWIDVSWFEKVTPVVGLPEVVLEVPTAYRSNISAQNTTELLNLWSAQIAKKLEPQSLSVDVKIVQLDDYERPTTTEMISVWKRLCKECKGLCRLRSKHYTCLFSESELSLQHINSSRELRVKLGNGEMVKHNGDLIEILRISKTPRGGYIFESTKKITSISHLAIKFMQDLMRSVDVSGLRPVEINTLLPNRVKAP